MSRLKKTKKLFYDKYLYKICVFTPLSTHFRGKDIEATQCSLRAILDEMEYRGETERITGSRWNSKKITIQNVRRDLALSIMAQGLEDFHFRVEGGTLSFYTNDETALDTAIALYDGMWDIREICKPENDKIKEFLLSNPKQIIRPEYSHKYKVTINGLDDPESFKDWAAKLPKLKVMPKNNYRIGGYFYVADQKTLSLCRIFLGDKIRRVDELRTLEEI